MPLSGIIANVGIAEFYATVLQTPIQGGRDHYNTGVWNKSVQIRQY
jgi:hypothetical protein